MSQAIYITNFPNQTNKGDLWRVCEKYGNVVDVFIANKKSRLGKNFGFVRFIKVFSLEGLVRDLCSVWIGNHKIFASIPRFSRKTNERVYKTGTRHVDFHSKPRFMGNVVNDKGSYAQVVKGKETGHIRNKVRPQEDHNKVDAIIDITAGNFIVKPNEIHQVVLGKVKDFKILPNLWMMCKNEGFLDVSIRYVGGVWVLFEFSNAKTCNNFKANGVVKEWFLEMKP